MTEELKRNRTRIEVGVPKEQHLDLLSEHLPGPGTADNQAEESPLAELNSRSAAECSVQEEHTVSLASRVPAVDTNETPLEETGANLDFGEQYQVEGIVGKGGMGTVYKAREKTNGRVVAIKALTCDLTRDHSATKRFEQEALSCTDLEHPSLVSIYGYGQSTNGTPYLVMDYIEGSNLADALANNQTIEPLKALKMFIAICEGLSYAHKQGIVHRDIKPSNIMLTNLELPDQVRILDFGIAKIVNSTTGGTTGLTQTGEVFGSPTYMSPEQCEGKDVDIRTDIYSIGCVMYEALLGMPPFQAESPIQVAVKHIKETPPKFPPKLKPKKQMKSLESVVMRCLLKNKEDRYGSMDELLLDLRAIEKGGKVSRYKPDEELPPWLINLTSISVLLYYSSMFLFVGSASQPLQSVGEFGMVCLLMNLLGAIVMPLSARIAFKRFKQHRNMNQFENLVLNLYWTLACLATVALALLMVASPHSGAMAIVDTVVAVFFILGFVAHFSWGFENNVMRLYRKYSRDKAYSKRKALLEVCIHVSATLVLTASFSALCPQWMSPLVMYAATLTDRGAPALASGLYKAAAALDDTNKWLYITTLETSAEPRKDRAEFLELLNKAVERHPRSFELYAVRAKILKKDDKLDDALADANRATELSEKSEQVDEALSIRAHVYIALGELEKAYRDYTTCIEKLPASESNYRARAAVSLAGKDYEQAIRDLSTTLAAYAARDQRGSDYLQLAIVYELKGDQAQAKANYKRALGLIYRDDDLRRVFAMKKLGDQKYKKLKGYKDNANKDLQKELSRLLFNPDLDIPFTW